MCTALKLKLLQKIKILRFLNINIILSVSLI